MNRRILNRETDEVMIGSEAFHNQKPILLFLCFSHKGSLTGRFACSSVSQILPPNSLINEFPDLLFNQNHLPCLHNLPGRKSVKIHSAGKIRGVKSSMMRTDLLGFIHQNCYSPASKCRKLPIERGCSPVSDNR